MLHLKAKLTRSLWSHWILWVHISSFIQLLASFLILSDNLLFLLYLWDCLSECCLPSGDNTSPEELSTQQHDGEKKLSQIWVTKKKKNLSDWLDCSEEKSHFSSSPLRLALKWQRIGTKRVRWLHVSVIREHFLIGLERHDGSHQEQGR